MQAEWLADWKPLGGRSGSASREERWLSIEDAGGCGMRSVRASGRGAGDVHRAVTTRSATWSCATPTRGPFRRRGATRFGWSSGRGRGPGSAGRGRAAVVRTAAVGVEPAGRQVDRRGGATHSVDYCDAEGCAAPPGFTGPDAGEVEPVDSGPGRFCGWQGADGADGTRRGRIRSAPARRSARVSSSGRRTLPASALSR